MFDMRRPGQRIPAIVGISLAAGSLAAYMGDFDTGIWCLVISGFVLELASWVCLAGDSEP